MALPAGVTTATVIAGVPVTHTGAAVKAFVSIEPSAYLVHAATGTPLVDFLEELDISEGTAGQFILPHTDQAGFIDGSGAAYTNWYYTARVTYSTPSKAKTKAPKVKVFQLTTGQTTIDLDLLPEGAPALPYIAPAAKVDAFNGRTGAVTLLDADLPERLSEAELSATYGYMPLEARRALTATASGTLALAPFFNSLPTRNDGGIDVLTIGDSITEGKGVSDYKLRWSNVLVNLLRSYAPSPAAGGVGYVAARFQSVGLTSPWTSSGTVTDNSEYGLGRRSVNLAAGATMTATLECTGFDVITAGWATSGAVGVTVDGGTERVFSTKAAAPVDGQRVAAIRNLTPGNHTIVIRNAGGGGSLSFNGVMVFNGDEYAGIRMWDGGHSSYKASDYLDATYPLWIANVATVQPDLVTIALGANEEFEAVPVATFKTNLNTLIANVRAKCLVPPAIMLLSVWGRGDMATSAWEPYRQAIMEVAIADGNAAFVDLATVFGPDAATNPLALLDADKIHPSALGNKLVAYTIAEKLRGIAYTAATAPAVTTYASDNFNRADGAPTHTPRGGHTWRSNVNGAGAIVSNQLNLAAASGGSTDNDIYIADGQADGTISVSLATATASVTAGLLFRATGEFNQNAYMFWRNTAAAYVLSKRTAANTYTQLGITATGIAVAGDVLSVVLNGSSITAKVNGTTALTATDASYAGTKHGVWGGGTAAIGQKYDDFSHTSATA